MMLKIDHQTGAIHTELNLPSSKSISNRLLVLKALYQEDLKIENLSEARDVELMMSALNLPPEIDVKDAGTVMRFILAYAAVSDKQVLIKGTPRMAVRPLDDLINALKKMDADIRTDPANFFPIQVKGGPLNMVDALDMRNVSSSQFISALLMIAPKVGEGMEIQVNRNMLSWSYVQMTLDLMRQFGFVFELGKDSIRYLGREAIELKTIRVEPDLASAMYWYAIAACANKAEILLRDVQTSTIQPEQALLTQLKDAGIETTYSSEGLMIRKPKGTHLKFSSKFDFSDNPDSASTILIMLAACTREVYEIKGLESLNKKESKREDNVKDYLNSMGAKLTREGESWQLDCRNVDLRNEYHFKVHQDHRMAMSLAPLALKSTVVIDDPEAVNKSYPGFWQDIKKANFVVQTQ